MIRRAEDGRAAVQLQPPAYFGDSAANTAA